MSDDAPHFTDAPDIADQPQSEPPRRQPAADAATGEAPPPRDARTTVDADGKITVVLTRPITIPGKGGMKELTEIVLRRPTGADILDIGNPVIFDPGRAQVTHDMQKMPLMIFRLSGVAPPVLGKLEPNDLVTCMWEVTHFFIPRM